MNDQEPTARTRHARALLSSAKYYLGLVVLLVIGALTSPQASDGSNIFLSSANISDVCRQVSNVGVMSIGMTLVIIIAGIDLSVGSIMGLGSVLTAMLLTKAGWSRAAYAAIVLDGASVFLLVTGALLAIGRMRAKRRAIESSVAASSPGGNSALAVIAGAVCAVMTGLSIASSLDHKMPLIGVLLVVPLAGMAIGVINGCVIAYGRMQPFIVTLAAMVGVMGTSRLIAGQDTAVYSIYSGSNASSDIESLRALLFGIVPVPALFFLAFAVIVSLLMNGTVFGKYLYAIGSNEKCARLSGLKVDRHKVTTYAISGALAALVGVLYAAQYRQGKADAGLGWELDAIAAVVIGGTSLMGGVGRISGTVAGVLIFGFLGNILLLNDIDSNTQLVLKGLIILVAVFLQQSRIDVGALMRRLGRQAR